MILVAVPVYVYINRSSSQHSTQPRLVFGDLQIMSTSENVKSVGTGGLSLDLNAVVYNPNDFGATLYSANYSVYADGHYVGTGHTAREFDIAPESSEALVFPISVGWESTLLTTGSYVVDWGSVIWSVSGNATIAVGGIPIPVPFKFAIG